MRGGLHPVRDRRQGHCLSSRPGAGLAQYDQLRSFRAEGGAGDELPSDGAARDEDVAPSSSLACDIAAIEGHYASRIAELRAALAPAELALIIRNLEDEKTLAIRAVIEKWSRYFQDEGKNSAAPEPPGDSRPVLRYPGLLENG